MLDALVWDSSTPLTLLEPSRTTLLQRYLGNWSSLTWVWGGSTVPNFLNNFLIVDIVLSVDVVLEGSKRFDAHELQ